MKYTKTMVILIAVSVLLAGGLASAADMVALGKVSSKAEIWLAKRTRFSGFALPAGRRDTLIGQSNWRSGGETVAHVFPMPASRLTQ